jgi:transcriptional regulator with XRE-family HTH domain
VARDEQAERLGRAIASRRAALGMRRKDLAAAAGLSYPYIAELENGAKSPSARALTALSEALDLSASGLLAQADALPSPGGSQSVATQAATADVSPHAAQELSSTDELVSRISALAVDRLLADLRRQLERDVPDVVRQVVAQTRGLQT